VRWGQLSIVAATALSAVVTAGCAAPAVGPASEVVNGSDRLDTADLVIEVTSSSGIVSVTWGYDGSIQRDEAAESPWRQPVLTRPGLLMVSAEHSRGTGTLTCTLREGAADGDPGRVVRRASAQGPYAAVACDTET
jgi:hypothetical protein